MRFISILRAAALALAVMAAGASLASAFADESLAAQTQTQQAGSTGPYDGGDYWAARNAYNN
jgi:hypothetical protein